MRRVHLSIHRLPVLLLGGLSLVVAAGCNADPTQRGLSRGRPETGDATVDVECRSAEDCQSGVCREGECAAPSCSDEVQNGEETDVDCGGPACEGCQTNQSCESASDCRRGTCTEGTCRAPTCSDKQANGEETDVDCGGPACDPCAPGESCDENADCVTGVCDGGTCADASCTDGVKNGDESDRDCGGPECDPCTVGDACSSGSDCTTGVCDGGSCVATTCMDGTENGGETDVDCGGPDCSGCSPGESCRKDRDCGSEICDGGSCARPACDDGVQNGDETDVDCGGPTCDACPAGNSCQKDRDCRSRHCSPMNACLAPACDDNIENGDETDVDCGGPTCEACNTGEACKKNRDCSSGVCQNGTCQSPSCSDGVANGSETAVDCGGPNCPGCEVGASCKKGRDCESGRCKGGTCRLTPRLRFGDGYRISDQCSEGGSSGNSCSMTLDCKGNDVVWNWQARRTDGDHDGNSDDFHCHADGGCKGTISAPKMSLGKLTVHASSCGGDRDSYRAWAWCIPRGSGFNFGSSYRVSASCKKSNGHCSFKLSCKGTDVAWLSQGRRTGGDDGNSEDDFHATFNSPMAVPDLSVDSVTPRPSTPGGDTDAYKAWTMCVPRGTGFDFGNAYKVSNTCTAKNGSCALSVSCKQGDRLWNYQARHTKGDGTDDDLHADSRSNSPPPTFTSASITLHPSSPGGDTDTYQIWGLCVPDK